MESHLRSLNRTRQFHTLKSYAMALLCVAMLGVVGWESLSWWMLAALTLLAVRTVMHPTVRLRLATTQVDVILATKCRVPSFCEESRLDRLVDGKNALPLRYGIRRPQADLPLLSVAWTDSEATLFLSEEVLALEDDALQTMIGHELGHLTQSRLRPADVTDFFFLAACVYLGNVGVTVGTLVPILLIRTFGVTYWHAQSNWASEMRADLYALHLFGSDRIDRLFAYTELAMDDRVPWPLVLRVWRHQAYMHFLSLVFFTAVLSFQSATIILAHDIWSSIGPIFRMTHPPTRTRRRFAETTVASLRAPAS